MIGKYQVSTSQNLFAIIVGIMTGYLSLKPVFGEAIVSTFEGNEASLDRILRIASPLLVWLLIGRKNHICIKTVSIIVLTLGIVPLIAGTLFGKLEYFILSIAPLIISLLVIIAIALLSYNIFVMWLVGVCCSCCGFLVAGVAANGLESTEYFGRSRTLLGFTHPLSTGQALLGVIILTYILFSYSSKSTIKASLKRIISQLAVVIITGSIWLLILADSRNTLIMVIIVILTTLSSARLESDARFTQFSTFFGIIIFLYILSFLKIYDTNIDTLSSERMSFFSNTMTSFFDYKFLLSLIIGVSNFKSQVYLSQGFAAIESVYLTFLLNYGLLSLLCLFWMLVHVGRRVAISQDNLALGCLCGVVVFFALDGLGITDSNLTNFILFAYPLRVAMIERNLSKDYEI